MGRRLRVLYQTKNFERKVPVCKLRRRKDVFGNIYKGAPSPFNEDSFLLKGLQPVGYYAIRPFWNDGHHSGIYPFEMLRTLCENHTD